MTRTPAHVTSALTCPIGVSLEDVRTAAERIGPHIHRTPVMTCATIDRMASRSLFFKCEMFQKGGAFKFRGAMNALLQIDDKAVARGVATHSSGNHAQALALAARGLGIKAHIVMPSTAPRVKREAVEGAGASVYESQPTRQAREALLERIIADTGAPYVPSYNDADIIAGQGTAALELLEDVPDLDVIVAPVGGGGLISGIAIAARAVSPGIRIIGAEPIGANDASRSKQEGRLVQEDSSGTPPKSIADGLLMTLGDLTWPVVRDCVNRIIEVSDEQIIDAMKLIWQRMKIVVEPSGATSLAAVLDESFQSLADCQRIGVILSGGNVDLDHLPWLSETRFGL